MEKSPSVLSYSDGKRLSIPPRAVVEWREGLLGLPIIFPMAETFEESEEIRRLLEGVFSNKGTSSAEARG